MIQRLLELEPREDDSAAEKQRQRKELSDRNRAPSGRDLISVDRQHRPQNASAIQWIGRKQIEAGDKNLRPGKTTRKIKRREPGRAEQMYLRPEDENRCADKYRKHQVDHRPGECHPNFAPCIQAALRLLIQQRNAGDGQQHNAANMDAVLRGDHDVTELVHHHREDHK